MPVRTRLILTLVGITLLLAAPAIFGASQLARLRQIAQQQREDHGRAFLAIGRLQAALNDLRQFGRVYAAVGFQQNYLGIEQALLEADRQISQLRAGGYTQQANTAKARFDAVESATRHLISLVGSGRVADASLYFETDVRPKLDNADASLDAIANAISVRSGQALSDARTISEYATAATTVIMIAAILVVAVVGFFTTRAITNPVRRLRHSMARVAAGNYVVPDNLPYDRKDEMGDLARSFSWMTQHLAKLDKMKAEFISIATHELKTPINVITGYTELVDEGLYGDLTPDQKQALHAIRDQAHGLTRLVNQLLDVSRLEAGGLQLAMNDVALESLMESLERTFSILANKKTITLTFSAGLNVPRMIQADPDRLRDQVLGNLLSNALKFTPESGHVGVRTWGDDSTLHIEVSDTGVGIASDQLPFVFDKYYQIGQQARSKGAGLGLAIARDIVEAHGGRISVESAENVGTTFRIELPVRQPVDDTDEVPVIVGADDDQSG